jgi:hypothetical protein
MATWEQRLPASFGVTKKDILMKRVFANATISILSLFFLSLLSAVSALAQQAPPKPIVIRPTAHDVSPPLSEMVAANPRQIETEEIEIEAPGRTPPLPGSISAAGRDTVLQTEALPLVATTPGLDFDGVAANGPIPPDTNGSVGASQYFQIVNVEFAIYDKTTGGILLGPSLINTIWSGFGGDCASGNGGDPVVLWDKAAQRWVVSQLSGSYANWCMAVSTGSDATGSYYRYAFSSNGNLDDYPKLGVWPDAYYRATNTFSGGFVGAKACAFDRALMLAGGAANEICFQQSSSVASLLPSDVDGNTAPPSGEPNFFVELYDTSDLGLFKFHVDFTNPSNSTFTGPTTIPVASFSEACGGGTCIPQPGTGQQLDSLGDRLMFRLAYRNFGDHEALVVNHSVTAGSSVGARWYEIRSPNGTPTVFQQGTFAPDSAYRWMGSVAMDQSGDIALGYSASSSSIFPAVRYTGRVPSDPSGSLETEASIIEGTGAQTSLSRWGDYSAMSVDPIDDCTFWYTNEYLPNNGTRNWHTRIASFKFSSCGVTTPDFSLSATPPSQTITAGGTATYTATASPLNGFSGTVGLTLSGCPANSTCTLNPTSVTLPPAQTSTLTVQTTSSTPGGTYTLTITGTNGSLVHTTTVTLIIPDFSISASPASQTYAAGGTATYKATVASLNGFSGTVGLILSGCPANSTCTLNPTSVTLPPTRTSTLTVATTKTTPGGTYTLTITGTSGSSVHSASVKLVVKAPDFSIYSGTSVVRVKAGGNANYGLTLTPLLGFSGSVSLSVTGVPSNSSGTFSVNPVTVTYPNSSRSTLTVSTTSTTPVGTYTLTITGTSGSLTHSINVTLKVVAP